MNVQFKCFFWALKFIRPGVLYSTRHHGSIQFDVNDWKLWDYLIFFVFGLKVKLIKRRCHFLISQIKLSKVSKQNSISKKFKKYVCKNKYDCLDFITFKKIVICTNSFFYRKITNIVVEMNSFIAKNLLMEYLNDKNKPNRITKMIK